MIRRRTSGEAAVSPELLEAFVWGAGDQFTETYFGPSPFATQAEARAAWPRCRRTVWAQCHRMRLPRAAEVFDGLTLDGLAFIRSHWNHVGSFDLEGALAALDEDRKNLAAFEQTGGAAAIADYLALLRRDLDAIEQAARDVAGWPGPPWLRPYPDLASARTYGDG